MEQDPQQAAMDEAVAAHNAEPPPPQAPAVDQAALDKAVAKHNKAEMKAIAAGLTAADPLTGERIAPPLNAEPPPPAEAIAADPLTGEGLTVAEVAARLEGQPEAPRAELATPPEAEPDA